MAISAGHYEGREQARIKHHFLLTYLGSLIHKVASAYSEVVYVDGFSGPWQSRGEKFEDTSFGIALSALTEAKRSWATIRGRQVRMVAHLVENNATAHARLAELVPMFPDVEIVIHHGDFTQIAPAIAAAISARAFSFILIDPKGFSLDLQALRPLIARDNCEVVFNFMFDFINRFALVDDPTIAGILDRLIPSEDWRGPLRALDCDVTATPKRRKRVLVKAFEDAVSRVGRYPYVANVDILRPESDRTLYFLVYGTRQRPGIQVFRDCQLKSLGVQSDARARKAIADLSIASKQSELLPSMNDMAPDPHRLFLVEEFTAAKALMLDLVSETGATWGSIWPQVLARHAVRLTDINRAANDYRKAGALVFPTWPSPRKSTPEDSYPVMCGVRG